MTTSYFCSGVSNLILKSDYDSIVKIFAYSSEMASYSDLLKQGLQINPKRFAILCTFLSLKQHETVDLLC